MLLAFQPQPLPVESASERLINTGALGAVCVVLFGAIAWLVVKWNAANEARVADQKEMAQTATAMTNGFKDAVRDISASLGALKLATEQQRETSKAATDDLARSVAKLENTLDDVVRDAVRSHEGPRRSEGPPRQRP